MKRLQGKKDLNSKKRITFDVPHDLQRNFSLACAVNQETMTNALTECIETYIGKSRVKVERKIKNAR